jgi:chromosome segregation ATPase
MKRELEREKSVLRSLFADFEQQQTAMRNRERELNTQYMALTQQMEEQYALQSSTAKIVEDYQDTIQSLNKVIVEERESYSRELNDMQVKCHGWEDKCHDLQGQLDEAKDLLRSNRQEIEAREFALTESQEKLQKTQRQLSQLRMETLESRVGPNATVTKDAETGQRGWGHHRRTTSSRRSVSATTYSTTGNMDYGKPAEPVVMEEMKEDALISFKGTFFLDMRC